MGKIAHTFKKLKKSGGKALIPYIMAGHPALNDTKRLVREIEEAGADIIELGVPFSDPLADGPTIQSASEVALKQGITLRKVITFAGEIRDVTDIPIVLMTYCNPVFQFGTEKFVKEASEAGVAGVIIPDLIPDEAHDFISYAKKYRLDTIFLLAPTSTEERIKKVIRASTGFIYYVSITGITGAQIHMDTAMKATLSSIRSMTSKPIAVGFGITSPEEASSVSKLADGVIVGSAIVRLIMSGSDVKDFVRSLRKAIS
jgi:tryptophan synthase alpha chain